MGGLNETDDDHYADEENQQFDSFNHGNYDRSGPNEEDGDYNPRKLRVSSGSSQVGFDFDRYPKRQKKLRSSLTNYELAPRSRIPSPVLLQTPAPSTRQIPSPEWSEHEKFVLLEIWGEKFLQLGRRSLRSMDWTDVAEKITDVVKAERTEEQCRGMLDVLKRKYKKEKVKGGGSKWVYFRKLDMLFGVEEKGRMSNKGLGCGLDAGEFIFMDTRSYLESANGNDEMRDSPCGSEGDDEDNEFGASGDDEVKGLRVLADSVMKFGEIYEKIEFSKREQLAELERMRVDFQKELELQKKVILDKAQEEIAKIRDEDDEEDDFDMENQQIDEQEEDRNDDESGHQREALNVD